MCGICGFLNPDESLTNNTETLHRMMAMLRHRGPDDSGCYIGTANGKPASVFLGHTRLKIIDLTDAASQPIANEDRTIFLVFNGEIYNFPELRKQLIAEGHRFRSASDSEVIVHAYEQYGDDFVKYLDGMFAFAIWDSRRGALLLARDRTGKKPLYYHYSKKTLTFGSEIKALAVCPWVNREVAVDVLPEYFAYGFVCAPRTLYRGIFQLPPASYLVFDGNCFNGPNMFWRPEFAEEGEEINGPIEAVAEEIRGLVTAAVKKRLISDVPLGALLSGGLDSSIVVGIMASLIPSKVHTFSIGFTDDASFDERPQAALVAKRFHTEHTEFVLKLDAMKWTEKILWHYDQPFGDSAAIPTYLVSKLARQYVTVALNGDGGDEIFGGYDRFRAALTSAMVPEFLMKAGAHAVRWLPRRYGYFGLKRRLERFFSDSNDGTPLSRYLDWIRIFNDDTGRLMLRDDSPDPGPYPQAVSSTEGKALLHRILQLNFTTYLPDDLNMKMDRMSMAHALETRSPFLDTAIIEYAGRLHPRLKINRGCTKWILRHAFRDLLPPDVIRRPKHGFGMPLGLWFKGVLGRQFQDMLLSPDAYCRTYLEPTVLKKLYDEHQAGVIDHGYRLWILLQFELWLRMLGKWPLHRPAVQDESECNVEVMKT